MSLYTIIIIKSTYITTIFLFFNTIRKFLRRQNIKKTKYYMSLLSKYIILKLYYKYWIKLKQWYYRDTISLLIYIRNNIIWTIPPMLRFTLGQILVWLLFFFLCKWKNITNWKYFLKRYFYNFFIFIPSYYIKLLINNANGQYIINMFYKNYLLNLVFYYFSVVNLIDIQQHLYQTTIIF